VAGVTAVTATVGIAIVQARAGRKHPPLGPDDRVRVVLAEPDAHAPGSEATALRAPTGRLPERVLGRDDLLACLRVLAEAPDGRVHVLAGLAGTGKSTVALRVVKEVTRLGRPAWWVPAVDAGTVTAKLLALARDLGAPSDEVTEALSGRRDPADLLWSYLEVRPGWLLIFDNADDLGALTVGGNDAAGGAGWVRPTTSGLVIVTSRARDPQAWGRHAELHAVGWLDAATGAGVLADLAPDAGALKDAAALSERLGGLPLALHHAGSQLASPFAAERTFAEYARALGERFERLMGHGAADDRAIVIRTWELSLDALAATGRPQARPLLRVLSCLAPAVLIPPCMLDLTVLGRACKDGSDGAADGLAALESVGLITTSPGVVGTRPGVTVHPLVTETSRLLLDAEDPAGAGGVAVALLTSAVARLRSEQSENWPSWVQLVPHLNAVYGYLARRLADDDLAALADVTVWVAAALARAGSYLASQELAEFALGHAARLGADHPAILSLRFRVASAQYEQAEVKYRHLTVGWVQVLDPNHPYTLPTRYQKAGMLGLLGRYEQAEQEFRDVLAVQARVLGPDHPDTLAARDKIAGMLLTLGRYEQAEQEFRDLLAVQARVLGPDHPDTLAARFNIAQILFRRGQFEQADHEFRDLLAAETRVFGPDHPDLRFTRGYLEMLESRVRQPHEDPAN